MNNQTLHGLTYDQIRANTSEVYHRATPTEHYDGMVWYRRVAQEIDSIIGYRSDAVFCRACETVAILSPRCPLRTNINAFKAIVNGEPPKGPVLGRNYQKALRHWRGENEPIVTRKVHSFARCLASRGMEGRHVCLDIHNLRASLGRRPTKTEQGRHFANNGDPGAYDTIADIYRQLAQEAGITPAQYQAVVWVVQRGRAW